MLRLSPLVYHNFWSPRLLLWTVIREWSRILKKWFLNFLLKILGEGGFISKKRILCRVTDCKEKNLVAFSSCLVSCHVLKSAVVGNTESWSLRWGQILLHSFPRCGGSELPLLYHRWQKPLLHRLLQKGGQCIQNKHGAQHRRDFQ